MGIKACIPRLQWWVIERITRLICSAILLATAVVVSGCANQLDMSYSCSPDGPSLSQTNGQSLGECPTNVQYPITQEDRARGYAVLQGVTAKWTSGATASISNITAYLRNGTSQTFHFERPTDAPNAAVDLQYATVFDRKRREQQTVAEQAQAQQDREMLAAFFCALASTRTNQPLTTNLQCQTAYMRGSAPDSETTAVRQCAQTGQGYDANTGNSYNCTQSNGELLLTGYNAGNGSRWTTYFSSTGDMRGVDASGNSWRYTASNSVYYNYGTGQQCVGTGPARTCTP
jgi:hypothetical protein